jgi:hypothetical protein
MFQAIECFLTLVKSCLALQCTEGCWRLVDQKSVTYASATRLHPEVVFNALEYDAYISR